MAFLPFRILVIEDDPDISRNINKLLEHAGYVCATCDEGSVGFEKACSGMWDAVILDIHLPVKDGLDIVRDIRRANINVPVLMVTGRNSVPDKVAGLKLGADDYLTKPFHNDELLARLDALLRRFGRAQTVSPSEVYKHAGLFADFKSGEFKLENKPFKLTAHEMKMLHYLVQHQGLIITRDELLTHVWKYGDTVTTRTVDVHVAAIRQKIEKIPSKPKRLISIYGLGYKFIG